MTDEAVSADVAHGGPRRRVAVVGLGVGLAHVRAYADRRDRFEIVAVCDPDRARADATAGRLRGVTVDPFERIVERDDIDVVSLCTPPHLHVDQTLALLESGKHVVCEKPLAGSLAAVDRLAEAASAADRWVMPVYQCRYRDGVQRLRHLVRAGAAGRPSAAAAEVAWRRRADYYAVAWRGRWETELGGVVVSHALHTLDLLTFVLGPARRVFARLATRVNDVETEDTASISIEHEGGAVSSVAATLGSTPQVSRLRFSFEHLTAVSDHEGDATGADPWVITGDTEHDRARIATALDGFSPGPPTWTGQLAAFDEALRAGGPPPVTLADARAGLEVATACYRSARTRQDVELPLSADDEDHGGWWL